MNPIIVSTKEELEECVGYLNQCEEIGVDLEFDKNRFRYGFNICLIQICAKSRCYIVDPLNEDIDYRSLFPVFENPEILKIVYSFNEDLRLLHSLGCFPKNIYDINFGVLFLNYPKTSLTTVLLETLKIEVGSSAQKSNWFDRPLSEKQIRYAAEDVRYLFDLKKVIEDQAKQKGVSSWIDENNQILENSDHENTNDKNIYPEKYKNGLSELEWHVLENLLSFREELAERANRPSYQIIHPEYLTELVTNRSSINRWMETKGIQRRLKNEKFRKDLKEKIIRWFGEGEEKGLSYDNPAKKPLSREEWLKFKEEREFKEKMRKEIFIPIQKKITEEYGEFAMPNILGKRAIFDYISGYHKDMKSYQLELVKKYADQLQLDVDQFISKEKSEK